DDRARNELVLERTSQNLHLLAPRQLRRPGPVPPGRLPAIRRHVLAEVPALVLSEFTPSGGSVGRGGAVCVNSVCLTIILRPRLSRLLTSEPLLPQLPPARPNRAIRVADSHRAPWTATIEVSPPVPAVRPPRGRLQEVPGHAVPGSFVATRFRP